MDTSLHLALNMSCVAGKLIVGAAKSGAVKSVVTSFADNVLLAEQFVKLGELDTSYWAYWLATTGYSDKVRHQDLLCCVCIRV